jgi:hypothetical protein
VTSFYDIDRANACLPEVRALLEQLRDRRDELIVLRDRFVVAQRRSSSGARADTRRTPADPARTPADPARTSADPAHAPADGEETPGDPPLIDPDSPRMLEARIRAVVDQMEAGVGRLVDLGIQLRESARGLIDFPALAGGRQVWLCWELGEVEQIHFWHEMNAGYSSRRPLIELT